MIKFLVFDVAGNILRTGECTYPDLYLQGDPLRVLSHDGGIDDLSHYIDRTDDSIQAKIPFALTVGSSPIVADGIALFTISGIPADTMVTWPDKDVIVTADDTVQWSEDLPGTYMFKFEHTQYLDAEVYFEAT